MLIIVQDIPHPQKQKQNKRLGGIDMNTNTTKKQTPMQALTIQTSNNTRLTPVHVDAKYIKAFNSLRAMFQNSVRLVASRLVKDEEITDFITREVFEGAYLEKISITDRAAASTWLHKRAADLSIDYLLMKRCVEA